MKTEKYILSMLCVFASAWAAKMAIVTVGMTRGGDPAYLFGLGEVAVFFGAALFPLLCVWRPTSFARVALIIAFVCLAYVSLLAANLIRLGFVPGGIARLLLWSAIAALLIRTRRRVPQSA